MDRRALAAGCLGLSMLIASAFGQTAQIPVCKAADLEIYGRPTYGGAGHGDGAVALRNTGPRVCSLEGNPRLEFLDANGHDVQIPYGKNEADYTLQPQPVHRVVLQPGDFAHFLIATSAGEDLQFYSMRVFLPDSSEPLMTSGPRKTILGGLSVSAFMAGADSRPGAEPIPDTSVSVSGPAPGVWAVQVHVPAQAIGSFAVHLTMKNTTNTPQKLSSENCSVLERLTNSAGKVVASGGNCGGWAGDIDRQGRVPAGGRVTTDFHAGGVAVQLCRAGRWTDDAMLQLTGGTIHLSPIPVEVVATACSDSEHVGEFVDEDSIEWTLAPRSGVRVGVVLRAGDGAAPVMEARGPKTSGPKVAIFAVGAPIELRIYVDDLRDEAVLLPFAANSFRIALHLEGQSGDKLSTPKILVAQPEGQEVTVLPHTWMYVGTVRLDTQGLTPGNDEIFVAPLAFSGVFAKANSPAQGWPFVGGAAYTQTFVKIR